MSAQQLADRCQQLGFAIPRPVLSNLENGRRESVTLAELVVLARALGVSPTLLVAPAGRQEAIEILPGEDMRTWDAARWVTGEADLRGTPGHLEATAEVDVDGPLFLNRLHESWLMRWMSAAKAGAAVLIENAEGELVPDEGLRAELREDAENEIRLLRRRMRKRGLLPPPLPPGLADIDELAEDSAQTAHT